MRISSPTRIAPASSTRPKTPPRHSGANALSGVVVVGAILVMLNADPDNVLILALGFVAVVLGIVNVVGGFAVTGRMLKMFKKNNK